MRLVVTSDTHFKFPVDFVPDGDVFIHCGDLMYTGYINEWQDRLDSLAALPHKTKLFIPGNHDLHIDVYPGPALQELRKAGVTVIGVPGNDRYTSYKLDNGMSVLGLPWVTGLPRWAWNRDEAWIDEYLTHMGRHKIVCSHAPPAGILDGKSYGIKAYRKYLKMYQPEYWFFGHVHEDYGQAAVDGCLLYNVAAQNESYTGLVNKPVVVDI